MSNMESYTSRVKIAEVYPHWLGPPPLREKTQKGKGHCVFYMEQRTLYQWLKERGYTVNDIAEKMDVSVRTVYGWTGFLKRPSLDNLLQLSNILDIDIRQILLERPDTEALPEMPESSGAATVSREQYEVAQTWLKAGRSKSDIAKAIGVSRPALYAKFAEFEAEDGQVQPASSSAKASAKASSKKPVQKRSASSEGLESLKPKRKAVKAVQ